MFLCIQNSRARQHNTVLRCTKSVTSNIMFIVHCVSRSGKEIVLTLILESRCIADNVIEQANLENMGAAFVILFLAVLQAEMLLLPV